MTRFAKWILLLGFLAGCATQPTKTGEGAERKFKPSAAGEKAAEEIAITEQMIVIDSRAPFEFSLSHIPRAINIQWTEFTQQEPSTRGVLLRDRFDLTRRLARIGISPTSEVLVVGNGTQGKGEEGRIAWTLAYLGVEKVKSAPMAYFKGHLTNSESPPPQPVNLWKPNTDESLLVTREELLYVINNRGVYDPITYGDSPRPRLYKIIDVRTSREYLGKEGLGMQSPIPNMEAINIPWTEFFDQAGRAKREMIARLHEVGVTRDQRVILIGEHGVRSAAVTMALRELGFNYAGNYAGGLQELMANPSSSKKSPYRKRK